MKRHLVPLVLIAILFSLVLTSCGSSAPKVDWELSITGAVSKPLTLSYKDLTKRDQVTLEQILMQKSHGEDQINTWEGPALASILEEAGASANAVSLICTASDSYAKEIPMADLDDSIIALKMDGKWIAGEGKGPIRLVVPSKPSDRWLFQLTSIEVIE
jgi:DMSO/TMAO reductase YedYZ molybdopterin-dependent catalytic subunit